MKTPFTKPKIRKRGRCQRNGCTRWTMDLEPVIIRGKKLLLCAQCRAIIINNLKDRLKRSTGIKKVALIVEDKINNIINPSLSGNQLKEVNNVILWFPWKNSDPEPEISDEPFENEKRYNSYF